MLQFGTPSADAVSRAGAYGIVVRDGLAAVVRWRGAIHLPGGGIEAGESPEEALHREVAEEAGLLVAVAAELGVAAQAVPRAHKPMLNKICHYFRCRVVGTTEQVEQDHELLWVPLPELEATLVLEADRWALAQAPGLMQRSTSTTHR